LVHARLSERAWHKTHRPGGRCMRLAEARAQISEEFVDGPRLTRTRPGIQRGRVPAFDPRAVKRAVTLLAAERIARRVAAAAMGEAFDQLAAAIPLGGLRLILRQWPFLEVEQVPQSDQ